MPNPIPLFVKHLQEAQQKATEAIKGMADGGTCNCDALILPVGRSHRFKRRSPQLDDALSQYGFFFAGSYRRGYILSMGGGQGVTRTVAAATAYKYLRDLGWDVEMWYQVD